MRRWSFSVIVALGMISICGRGYSQTNTFPWPSIPPVGIGTQPSGATYSLEIHCDPSNPTNTLPAILRFSSGWSTITDTFAILGLMKQLDSTFTSLPTGQDLILHEHKKGDIIITNFWGAKSASHKTGGSIRLATAGDTSVQPYPIPTAKDLERVTILPNGNVGIDLPPDSATGLGIPMEQLQVGGGCKLPPFLADPVPGLTIYGGNRYEGMRKNGDTLHTFPVDWRAISFNHYHDPWSGNAHRFSHMSSSGLRFSDFQGGLLQLACWPYDTTLAPSVAIDSFGRGVFLEMHGNSGLGMYCDEGATDRNHQLFNVYRPHALDWPFTRNTNGLFFHHTPVYIGSDSGVGVCPDFTKLSIRPAIGDDTTWMLAVNGAALFKEAFVSTDWPDFVFDLNYKLMPLIEVEKFIGINHHLPGVPSAKEIATTGVPLGSTAAKQMQKTEELTLYIIELSKKIERLEAKVEDLESKKER